MEDDLFEFEPEIEPGEQLEPEVETVYEKQEFADDEFVNSDDEVKSDYITRLLESKGIKNRTVQIEDENGELQDVNFDDLSDQEKFDLLSEQEEQVMPSDDELQTLNYLRQNNMTLKEFADWQKQVGVQEYLNGQAPVTEFDSYSDDEMIAYDFIQRFGEDMTDEEIDAEIERLKADPDAYQKRVDLLRNAYKNEEEAQARLYQEQEQSKNEAALAAFQSAYADAASNMNYIHGMNLDENDKQELLQFVLTKDAANRTGLSRALDNPESVLKMAWYLLHGEETYDATVDYFKKEISKRDRTPQTRAVTRQRSTQKDAFKF